MQGQVNLKEFVEEVRREVESQLVKDKKVIIQPVVKNNGTVYEGLIILDSVTNVSPTIYLNSYYKRYLDGISMEEIIDDVMQTYEENLPEEDFDISLFKDFSKAKGQIIMKLVNTKSNLELLEDVPNKSFYDLSIIYCVAVSDFMNEYATILIHNEHLTFWGITEEELHDIAIENTPKLLPYYFENMKDILVEAADMNFPQEMEMYVLTNKTRINGAVVIAYKGLLEEIAERLDDNFYIIPSSIHEVLIIPWKSVNAEYTFKDFNEMVEEVNETQLTDDEMLSNHIYFYNKTDGSIIY